jgi:hypothetical protein
MKINFGSNKKVISAKDLKMSILAKQAFSAGNRRERGFSTKNFKFEQIKNNVQQSIP